MNGLFLDQITYHKMKFKQECIPVGCVPSATVAVSLGGGCLLLGKVWSQGGCLLLGGACSWVECLLLGGGGIWSWRGIPACTEADPPVDRQTHVKT